MASYWKGMSQLVGTAEPLLSPLFYQDSFVGVEKSFVEGLQLVVEENSEHHNHDEVHILQAEIHTEDSSCKSCLHLCGI